MDEFTGALIGGAVGGVGGKLIDKAGAVLGIVFEPQIIMRKKLAEYEADKAVQQRRDADEKALRKITDEAGLPPEIPEELVYRAYKRFVHEECKRQQNIENILGQAIEDLPESADPEGIDDDWLSLFFESCSRYSDEDIQKIWAGMLCKEAIAKESISIQTIKTMSLMGRSDLQAFVTILRFSVTADDDLFIVESWMDLFAHNGAAYSVLSLLESFSLLSFRQAHVSKLDEQKRTFLRINGKNVVITATVPHYTTFPLGEVALTRSGHELAGLCIRPPYVDFFYQFVTNFYSKNGYAVTEME